MVKFREIREMGQYEPPLEGRSSGDYLLLDANERTIPPSPRVKEALQKFIDSGRLQVYPEYGDLEGKIAQYAGVSGSQVTITNGGDQGIDIICRAHLSKGDKVVIPLPSFSMYYRSADVQGAELLEPSYNEEKGSFPLEEVLSLISSNDGIKLIMLSNPNNPLGTSIPIEDVDKILAAARDRGIAVLHDEAYFEFLGITCSSLTGKYSNLYIIRTFSKAFGLAAVRIGYIISQEENLRDLSEIRGPYDVNMFAKIAVLAALEDLSYMRDYVKEVMQTSKPRLESFLKGKGISFFRSTANFLFLRVPNSKQIFENLKNEGVLVRLKKGPDDKTGIRVTIGTSEDTDNFISAFDKVTRR